MALIAAEGGWKKSSMRAGWERTSTSTICTIVLDIVEDEHTESLTRGPLGSVFVFHCHDFLDNSQEI